MPWYAGYKGEIRRTEKGFESVGRVEVKKEVFFMILEVWNLEISLLVENRGLFW